MITRVEIENYRGFKSFEMNGLTQVNLLVGKNNSGKTALIEALHLITSGGDPFVLSEAAHRRGELAVFDESGRITSDLTHFFHGHELSASSAFTLKSDNGVPKLTVRLVPLPTDSGLFGDAEDDLEGRAAYSVAIDGAIGFGAGEKDLGLSERGGLIFNPRYRTRPISSSPSPLAPSLFVSTDSVGARKLSQLWRQAVLDSVAPDVVAAMRLIDPTIHQILYLPLEGGSRSAGAPSWFVQTTEFPRPVPLGSFGDGLRRMMNLALSLARTHKGTLLVDEIDTGLHYTVMADLWKLVVKAASRSNTQVFATTHSWDCLKGLAQLLQDEPQLATNVSVHTIDRSLPHSIPFAGKSIDRMVRHDADPR